MNHTDILFTVTINDAQRVAKDILGKELSPDELNNVKRQLEFESNEIIGLILRISLEG